MNFGKKGLNGLVHFLHVYKTICNFGCKFSKVVLFFYAITNQRLVIDTCSPHPGLVLDIDVFVFDMDPRLVFSRLVFDMGIGLVS